MDKSRGVESAPNESMQPAGVAALRRGDAMLQSRFRRAYEEASPTQTDQAATDPAAELVASLERMCSAMFVGDRNIRSQRIVLMLDHVLPGAAAEIVREGVHLTVRLHARTQAAYRLLSSHRESLVAALRSSELSVHVVVVYGGPAPDCRAQE